MSKFDAAIRTLKSTLGDVDEYGVIGQEADETKSAIRVLEAAAKVSARERGEMMDFLDTDSASYALYAALPDSHDKEEK